MKVSHAPLEHDHLQPTRAALLVCGVALYVQRKIRERRERDKARRAWEGLDEPGNGSVCVWNREDPINGTRVRIRHPQG